MLSKTFFRRNTVVFQGKTARFSAKRTAVRVRWQLEEYTLDNRCDAEAVPCRSPGQRGNHKLKDFCGRAREGHPPSGRIRRASPKSPARRTEHAAKRKGKPFKFGWHHEVSAILSSQWRDESIFLLGNEGFIRLRSTPDLFRHGGKTSA